MEIWNFMCFNPQTVPLGRVLIGRASDINAPTVSCILCISNPQSLLSNGLRKSGYGSQQNGGYVSHTLHTDINIDGDENDRFIHVTEQQQRVSIT